MLSCPVCNQRCGLFGGESAAVDDDLRVLVTHGVQQAGALRLNALDQRIAALLESVCFAEQLIRRPRSESFADERHRV